MPWLSHLLRRTPPTLAGLFAITGAVFLRSLSDALVKRLSGGVSLGQVLVVRSCVAAVLRAATLCVKKSAGVRGFSARPWVWARSCCLTLMWGCYYAALPVLPFSLAAACYYTAPIWMAVLSAGLFRHCIGWRGAGAIALGLSGMITILRPGPGDLSPVMVLPLLAGILYAVAAMITYGRCRGVAPVSLALNLNLVLAAAGAALVVIRLVVDADDAGFHASAWPPLEPSTWALLAGLGGLLAVVATATALAYQLAPAPVVGLFDNGYLVFALFWSAALFGEVPAVPDLAGVVLIGGGAVLASLAPRRCRTGSG